MGFRWSFERGGFEFAPPPSKLSGKVFVQSNVSQEWSLTEMNYDEGVSLLNDRISKYRLTALSSGLLTVAPGLNSGNVVGLSLWGAPTDANLILHLVSSIAGGSLSPNSPHPLGAGDSNVPAYAWIPITIPSNAIFMSFDFLLEGDGQNDSLAVALNGTNVLSAQLNLMQTNVALNSGPIDVSPFAGEQVEFFAGIVGGTSTNASVTVSNVLFYLPQPPPLQARVSGGDLLLSWPLAAQDYALQSTTNLGDPNSWITLTNAPTIVDLENAVTNTISGGARFYRLKK